MDSCTLSIFFGYSNAKHPIDISSLLSKLVVAEAFSGGLRSWHSRLSPGTCELEHPVIRILRLLQQHLIQPPQPAVPAVAGVNVLCFGFDFKGAQAYTVVRSSNVSNRLANFGRNFGASSAHGLQHDVWAALNLRQRSVSLLIFFSHNTEVDSWILKLNFKILINLK